NYTIEGSNELISGANCSVDWQGASNIVSVADEFIISLDTNGLSINDYTALITLEQVGYTTAFKSVTIIVSPIQTNADANKSIVNAYYNEIIYLKVNYTVEGSNELISGANCSVEWDGVSNIVSIADEFIISLDTNGLSINDYTALITLEQVGYTTAFKSVTIIVSPIQTNADANSTVINAYLNDVIYLKVNYTIESSNELISGAICSVEWQGASNIVSIADEFIISLDTNGLSIIEYTALIKLEHVGYTTAFKSVTIIVNPIQTNADANKSIIYAYLNEIVYLKINYTIESSNDLISGANCSVEWEEASNIVSVIDGFIISLDTNGLSIIDYTALIKLEHVRYATAFLSVTIIVNPIQTNAVANKSIINACINEVIDLKVNYTIEDSNELISGANCSVEWQGASNIVYVADGFIISLDTNGISINEHTILIILEHVGYATAFKSITIIISTQNIDLTVAIDSLEVDENSLIPYFYNEVITLSCRAYAAFEQIFLSGGTITFINAQIEHGLVKFDDSWFNISILISTSTFSLGINYVYIEFQQDNYTTTTFSFQFLVNQIEIDVQTIDFPDSIDLNIGEKIQLKINLTEFGTNNFIENVNISYYWDFGLGYFEEIGGGIYKLEIVINENMVGSNKITLIITKEGAVYKAKESSFLLVIDEPEFPVFIVWIIIIVSAAIISILGTLSLRAYVILPRRRKKEAELISTVQVFKDVWDIRAVILIHKDSGLPLYSDEISALEGDRDTTLISGFVQAITAFSETMIQQEFNESRKLATDYEYLRTIIDLDFKFFQLLVCDYDTIRVLLILRSAASERLKKHLYLLAVAINSKFGDKFRAFTGDVGELKEELQDLFNQFLFLHYSRTFEISLNKKYLNAILESGELTKMETRLVNVIKS
ncbi:MAG: hypothetical protein ACTSSH_08440, partial [Candidatus Heimdallarchaeota archaeon]